MKTNKIIILTLAALLLTSLCCNGQTNYFTRGQDIPVNGAVYIYDGLKFYNKANQLTGVKQAMRDGSKLVFPPGTSFSGKLPSEFDIDKDMYPKLLDKLKSMLTETEMRYIANTDDELNIVMKISPDTGEIMEMEFGIGYRYPGFVCVPPAKYYEFEKWIKATFKATPTPLGRTRNWNFLWKSLRSVSFELPEVLPTFVPDSVPIP